MGTVMTAHARVCSLDMCCNTTRWSVKAQAPGDQELRAIHVRSVWKPLDLLSDTRNSTEAWTLLELTGVTGVPRMDVGSLSDPYVHAVVRRGRFARCLHRLFPYALNGYNVVWELRRYLQAPVTLAEGAHPSDTLELHVYEHDSACEKAIFGKDLIGAVKVSVAEIEVAGVGEVLTVPLNLSAKAKAVKEATAIREQKTDLSTISIRTWPSSVHEQWPKVKWIFLIRHGESAWNVAEKDPLRGIGTLVGKIDHFLSDRGCAQASELSEKISCFNSGTQTFSAVYESSEEGNVLHQSFAEAEVILVSPLARALQTALLCLQSHRTALRDGLKLRSELREVKSYWGRDTQSKSRHHEILERCFEDFKKKGVDVDVLQDIQVDTGNTRHEWWDASMEHPETLHTRTRELLTQVKLRSHRKVIMVTHSILIKHIIRAHMCPGNQTPLAAALTKTKLPNCGVLAIRANFQEDVDCCIDRVHLLFDTPLAAEGPGDPTFQTSDPSLNGQVTASD